MDYIKFIVTIIVHLCPLGKKIGDTFSFQC